MYKIQDTTYKIVATLYSILILYQTHNVEWCSTNCNSRLTPEPKLLGKAIEVCVYTKTKIVIKIDWMFATYRQYFVKNPLNYDIDTFTSSAEHCEYMSQCALQHTAEAKTSLLYFSLILSNLCSTHLFYSGGWWLMTVVLKLESTIFFFSLLLNLTCDNNANKTVDSFEEVNEGPSLADISFRLSNAKS